MSSQTSLSSSTALSTGAIINGLGDSITAQSQYQPANINISNIPAWANSTVYIQGNTVQNGGYVFYVGNGGGTSAATGSGPTPSSLSDNGINWGWNETQSNKPGNEFLAWAELFSLGRLTWDQSQGYAGVIYGIVKVIVTNPGSGYSSSPTINLSSGATGTVQTDGAGHITGVTILSPGHATGSFGYSITDGTGSGAVLSIVSVPSGTFGVPGCLTYDMVARLPDVVASNCDIIVVHGGTNDLTGGQTYAAIIGNLRTCYETIISAGKKVIAVPITPRDSGYSTPVDALMMRVNKWIRAYCRKESWANPLRITSIALADVTGYYTDGTSLTNYPIGGNGGVQGAMTLDGLHPSNRGGAYFGLVIWLAAQQFIGPAPYYTARSYTQFDGYDPVQNPGGNMLEGLPWQASNPYTLGAIVSNSGNVYYCLTAGTSASSGGPTGTGSNITDGAAHWAYIVQAGRSTFNSGTFAVGTFANTGMTGSGVVANGYTLTSTGTSTGTCVAAVESPWSNGQIGQRQTLTISLGNGSINEGFGYNLANKAQAYFGIQPGDLGTAYIQVEMELELSGVANLEGINLYVYGDRFFMTAGPGGGSAGTRLLQSNNEPFIAQNNGKMILKTQPMLLPATNSSLGAYLGLSFDGTGAANSATATIKINYFTIHKAYVA